jgi:hypothetical protein
MASRTATCVGVDLIRGNDDAPGSSVTNYSAASLKRAMVSISNNGLDWVGGTDTITIDLSAALAAYVRNGKTQTVQGCPAVMQAMRVDNAGAQSAFAAYVTLSSNTLTIVPKTNGYLTGSTNGSVTGSYTLVAPLVVAVAYTEA